MEQRRLYHIQNLAFEIMDEMNADSELERKVDLKHVVDHLSRAIGSLADPTGTFSVDYVEEKIAAAHYSIFKNEKKLSCLKINTPAVK
ncbi:hypothetical protein ACQ0QQ_14660 [Lysinibacillus sphaericus]